MKNAYVVYETGERYKCECGCSWQQSRISFYPNGWIVTYCGGHPLIAKRRAPQHSRTVKRASNARIDVNAPYAKRVDLISGMSGTLVIENDGGRLRAKRVAD